MSRIADSEVLAVAPTGSSRRAAATTRRAGAKRATRARDVSLAIAYPTAFVVALLVLWQIVVQLADIKPTVLPAPTEIASSLGENWAEIWSQTWPTVIEILAGFAIAVVVGIVTAIVITTIPAIDRMVRPLLVASLVVPKIAIAPIFVIWFGFGYTPKVLLVAIITFFPIVVDTALGLKSLPLEMRLLMRSMGANRFKAFWKITFPHALPNVFVGLKVGMALAVVGAIVAEFVQSSKGLGFLLLQANQSLDIPLFFAGILAVTVVGVVLYVALEGVEALVMRSRR